MKANCRCNISHKSMDGEFELKYPKFSDGAVCMCAGGMGAKVTNKVKGC